MEEPVRFGKPTRDLYPATDLRRRSHPDVLIASDLARALGVNPGQVWTWKSRRDRNGFPNPCGCTWTPWRDGRFGGSDLYRLEDVQLWFKEYDPRRKRSQRKGETR